MAGYVAFRLFGARRGALVAGLLGGLISSTATAVGYARRSREAKARSDTAAFVVVLASTVVFGRVMLEISLVAPSILRETAPPLVAMAMLMVAVSGGLFLLGIGQDARAPEDPSPPSELGPALAFGALYAVILFAVAFAEDRFGTRGLYVVAALSGLTDMDAITLSTAQLMKSGSLDPGAGWRMILMGALSNLSFKGVIVLTLGSSELRRRVGAAFGLALLGGVAILLFWPG
jgi:uncharacterized membrane protein (DUF4010 family)